MPILPEEFDQFVAEQAGKEPTCEGWRGDWACRSGHQNWADEPASLCPEPTARSVRCDGPANLLVMIDGTHSPSWGHAVPACSAHWRWALEHAKAGSQA